MKINEIVSESTGKIRKGVRNSLSDLTSYADLSNSSNPYLAYRFGVALAKSPDDMKNQEGPLGSDFVTIGYSDADNEIINHARKEFGIKGKVHGGKGSVELDKINTSSPVAKRKKNKYGV